MQKEVVIKKQFFIQHKGEDIHDFYEIGHKEIGYGAFGKVFLGKSKMQPNTIRAIKIITKEQDHSLAENQIAILKTLDYPNILKLYEIFEDQTSIFLVTDYFEGGDLFQRLETGVFTEEQARIIFFQALEAVAYCHGERVMHRDIKPENLMFLDSKTLNLKVIDFGLALRWQTDARAQIKQNKTKAMGSIYYISPEVIRNDYTEKCDVWSLGVLLYILLTAQFPFDGISDHEIMKNILFRRFTTQIYAIKNTNAELRDILRKLFAKEAIRPTARELFDHPWIKKREPGITIKLNFSKLASFSRFSKVKTLAVTYIASQLSEKDIERIATLFKQIDVNHDGYLSLDELQKAFKNQQQKTQLKQLSKIMNDIDIDKNGKINYTEFINACLQNSMIFKKQNLAGAFKLMDKDKNGKIEKNQIKALLKENNFQIDSALVDEIIESCDKDGDGCIDYKEFVQNISQH